MPCPQSGRAETPTAAPQEHRVPPLAPFPSRWKLPATSSPKLTRSSSDAQSSGPRSLSPRMPATGSEFMILPGRPWRRGRDEGGQPGFRPGLQSAQPGLLRRQRVQAGHDAALRGALNATLRGGLDTVVAVGLNSRDVIARPEGPGTSANKFSSALKGRNKSNEPEINPTRTFHPRVCSSSRRSADTRSGNLPACDAPPGCGCTRAPSRRASDSR